MQRLEAINLKKSFKSRTVVKSVSLHINPGEIIGLLGPNGAGKTTSFYMIAGLIGADDGQILLNGQDITKQPMHKRARAGIGYLPQEPSIFRKMNVSDNILAILQLNKARSKKMQEQRLTQLLQDFHLEHLSKTMAFRLSGGERRRVEIARALASDPQFLLLDEPFAGIDPISVTDIQRIIVGLAQKNIGILITDHNVRETLALCQRGYIVNEGTLLHEGTPEEILASDAVRSIYLGHKFKL